MLCGSAHGSRAREAAAAARCDPDEHARRRSHPAQWLHGPEIPVACFGRSATLKHPEVDKHTCLRGLDEIARAGYLAGGAA